jgi:hypothetical protein
MIGILGRLHVHAAAYAILLLLLPRPAASECRQVHDPAGAPVYSQLCGGSFVMTMPFCTWVEYTLSGVQGCTGATYSCWIEILLHPNQKMWLRQAESCGSGSTVANCIADKCNKG